MASDRIEYTTTYIRRAKRFDAIVRWAAAPLAVLGIFAGSQTAGAQTTFDQLLGLYPPRYPAGYAAQQRPKRVAPETVEDPAPRNPNRNVSYTQSRAHGEPRQIKAMPAKVVRQAPPPPVVEGEVIHEGPGEMWEEGPYGHGGGCNDGCCNPCRPTGLWIRAEYLSWWTRGWRVPPLVTTAPTTGTAALDDASTTILFGNTDVNDDARSGGRIWAGRNFICNPEWAWEMNYFNSGEETTEFNQGPTGAIIARPFFNIRPDAGLAREDAELVADPGDLDGVVLVDLTTEFQGGELLLKHALCNTCDFRFDVVGGYRFARLEDTLRVEENLDVISGAGGQVIGTSIDLFDQFDTRNEFHGVDLGMVAHYRYCRWAMDLTLKLALGNTNTDVTINGQSTTFVPGAGGGTSVSPGGLLTQSSNIGVHSVDHFSVMPELGILFRYDFNPCLQGTFGYNFIYWSYVGRPGDQVDLDVNLTQQPPGPFTGAARPQFDFKSTDFWAQGLSVGLQYTF